MCYCCVRNCRNHNNTGKYSMYRFPRCTDAFETNRYHQWIKATGNKKLAKLDHARVCRTYRVCQVHFSADQFFSANCNITNLRRDAIPNINLPLDEDDVNHVEVSSVQQPVSTSNSADGSRKEVHSAPIDCPATDNELAISSTLIDDSDYVKIPYLHESISTSHLAEESSQEVQSVPLDHPASELAVSSTIDNKKVPSAQEPMSISTSVESLSEVENTSFDPSATDLVIISNLDEETQTSIVPPQTAVSIVSAHKVPGSPKGRPMRVSKMRRQNLELKRQIQKLQVKLDRARSTEGILEQIKRRVGNDAIFNFIRAQLMQGI